MDGGTENFLYLMDLQNYGLIIARVLMVYLELYFSMIMENLTPAWVHTYATIMNMAQHLKLQK